VSLGTCTTTTIIIIITIKTERTQPLLPHSPLTPKHEHIDRDGTFDRIDASVVVYNKFCSCVVLSQNDNQEINGSFVWPAVQSVVYDVEGPCDGGDDDDDDEDEDDDEAEAEDDAAVVDADAAESDGGFC